MFQDPTSAMRGGHPSGMRLIDEITWELRISLGFAIRDSLQAFNQLPFEERPDYEINVARRCPCGSRLCRMRLTGLVPEVIGDIGTHAYERGVGDSMLAFALSETLVLVPDLGQLAIRNDLDWPHHQAVFGAIPVRHLVRDIVERCWEPGDKFDPVIQFAVDTVTVPLEGLRQYLRALRLS